MLLELCEHMSGTTGMRRWFWGPGSTGQIHRRDSNSGGSVASHAACGRTQLQVFRDHPLPRYQNASAQGSSRSLAGAWSFYHRIRFPCGIFVSTFYSFKKTDNTGRERRLEPRTRIEFLMKIATLQEPLFPIVFHASHTQTTSQTWGGMDYVVSELEPMQILDYRLTDRILHQL